MKHVNIKYVFIGRQPENIIKSLDAVDVMHIERLSEEIYISLNNHFGNSWESDFGIYSIGKYSALTAKGQFRRDPLKILKDNRIVSKSDARRYAGNDPIIINCIRRCHFADKNFSHRIDADHEMRLRFVSDFMIRLDEPIYSMKDKIGLVLPTVTSRNELLITSPEGTPLELKVTSNEEMFQFRGNDTLPDPRKLFAKKDGKTLKQARLEYLRTISQDDLIVHDIISNENLELNCEVYDSLFPLALVMRNEITFDLSSVMRTFFPSGSNAKDPQSITPRDKLTNKETAFIRSKYITEETGFNFIRKFYSRDDLMTSIQNLKFSMLQMDFRNGNDSLDNRNGATRMRADIDGDKGIDLHSMFSVLEMCGDVFFAGLRTETRGINGFLSKYKIQRDFQYICSHQDKIKRWFANPHDVNQRKMENLSIKLRPSGRDNDSHFITLIFKRDGSFKIGSDMNGKTTTSATISFKSVYNVVDVIDKFIRQLNKHFEIFVDQRPKAGLQLPFLSVNRSLVCDTNLFVRDLTLRVRFTSNRQFEYREFARVTDLLPMVFDVSQEQDIIKKFWQKTPRAARAISGLKKLNLFDIRKLNAMRPAEWKKLNLIGRNNDLLVDDFRASVMNTTEDTIVVNFKRVSKHDTLAKFKQMIKQFLATPSAYQELVKEKNGGESDIWNRLTVFLMKGFSLNQAEARDVMMSVRRTDRHGAPDPLDDVSSGVRCELVAREGRFDVSITGIRNTSRQSSVIFLFFNVLGNLASLIKLFNEPEKKLKGLIESHGVVLKNLAESNDISRMDASGLMKLAADDPDVAADTLTDVNAITNVVFDGDEMVLQDAIEDADLSSKNVLDSTAVDDDDDEDAKGSIEQVTGYHSKKMTAEGKGSYHLTRLQNRDPELFTKTSKWKKSYATKCQRNQNRQPIVLTPAEYENQDKTTFKSPSKVPGGLLYRGLYYICPEIWCPSLGRALHPHELRDAKYDDNEYSEDGRRLSKVISGTCPDGEDAMIANYGINGWKAKGISSTNPTRGRSEFPGFITGLHPNGWGVPCCFQKDPSLGHSANSFFQILRGQSPSDQSTAYARKRSASKYIKQHTSFPLGIGRLGAIDPTLDAIMGSGLGGQGGRFLRCGIEQASNSPFLGCVVRALTESGSASMISDAAKNAVTSDLLARHLALKISHTPEMFKSLKNGYLPLIFSDFIDDDPLQRYVDYLMNESNLDEDFLWDMVSRPSDFLFRDGLNIFVIKRSEKRGAKAKAKFEFDLPTGDYPGDLYSPSRQSLFVFAEAEYREPLLQENTSSVLVGPNETITYLIRRLCNQSGTSESAAWDPYSLIQHGSIAIRKQFVDNYNRVTFFDIDRLGIYPAPTDRGPLWIRDKPISISYAFPPAQCLSAIENDLKTFNTKFHPSQNASISHLISVPRKGGKASTQSPFWAVLTTGNVLPLKTAAAREDDVNKYGVIPEASPCLLIESKNARLMQQSRRMHDTIQRFHYIQSLLDRLKMEFSNYLEEDLKSKSVTKKWFTVFNILTGKTETGINLSVFDKRQLLMSLLLKRGTGMLWRFVSVDTPVHGFDLDSRLPNPTGNHEPSDSRTPRPCGQLTPSLSLCHTDGNCVMDTNRDDNNKRKRGSSSSHGVCKLSIPSHLISVFASLMIEGMLREHAGAQMLMNNRVVRLNRGSAARFKSDPFQIEFDSDVTHYFLWMICNLDYRSAIKCMMPFEKQSHCPLVDDRDTARQSAMKLKEYLLFHAVIDQVMIRISMALATLKPTSTKGWLVFADSTFTLDLICYVIGQTISTNDFTKAAYTSKLISRLRGTRHRKTNENRNEDDDDDGIQSPYWRKFYASLRAANPYMIQNPMPPRPKTLGTLTSAIAQNLDRHICLEDLNMLNIIFGDTIAFVLLQGNRLRSFITASEASSTNRAAITLALIRRGDLFFLLSTDPVNFPQSCLIDTNKYI